MPFVTKPRDTRRVIWMRGNKHFVPRNGPDEPIFHRHPEFYVGVGGIFPVRISASDDHISICPARSIKRRPMNGWTSELSHYLLINRIML